MIRVIFQNLEQSEFARDLASRRIESIVERFPALSSHKIQVTLSMENSPRQAGPDVFTVKLMMSGRIFQSIIIKKSAPSLYIALADVVDHALERLNRFGDKKRVKRRKQARREIHYSKFVAT